MSLKTSLTKKKLFIYIFKKNNYKVEKNVKNNSVSIHVLPNKTYKFKLQLKDKFTNWTDVEETQNIFCKTFVFI